ncbi:unnamed protein product [Durusdinium trenchii]|uniref:Uncharacterized protein n=1 Tax=Durusdinium trenchii TaxID=1381693 RepID=A0ABP0IYM6_9DINO
MPLSGICYDPFAILTPSEVAMAIRSFPALKFEEPHLLLRMLHSLSPNASPLLMIAGTSDAQEFSGSLLHRMTMAELVDIFEAFGEQGLSGCDLVAEAIVHRYRANGGRLSRRNTARTLNVLAQLGPQKELLELLLEELNGWQVSDPAGSELRPRPALTAVWSLCILDLLPRMATVVDWFLEFLCREAVASYALGTKAQALQLFESLGAVQSTLPQMAKRHLDSLMAGHSPAAEQVIFELGHGRRLRSVHELLALPRPVQLEPGSEVPNIAPETWSSLQATQLGGLNSESADDLEGNLPADNFQGRSLLDELAMQWEMKRSQQERAAAKCKELIGFVLAGLNAAPLLLAAPHPLGLVARDELRGSGGFEAQWPTGWYDVDWGHPFFRLGLVVLRDQDFLQNGRGELRGAVRLRLRMLSEERWWLILLRASAVERWIVPKERQLFNRQLQARVARANKLYPLEQKLLQRRMRHLDQEATELRKLFTQQLRQQLDFIFPDALTAGPALNGAAKLLKRGEQPGEDGVLATRRDRP